MSKNEASTTTEIERLLALPVPVVPPGATGLAWLRSHVARFSEGPDHDRRRGYAVAALAEVEPADLRASADRRGGHPVMILAAALGLVVELDDVRAVAAAYHPHLPGSAAAEAALERMVEANGGRTSAAGSDDRLANRLGLLVQACEATARLAERAAQPGWDVERVLREDPPVRLTRRGPIEVDLASGGLPWGAGPHACPGRFHAAALVHGLIEHPQPTAAPTGGRRGDEGSRR